VLFYGVVSEHARETVELFVRREEAEAFIAEVETGCLDGCLRRADVLSLQSLRVRVGPLELRRARLKHLLRIAVGALLIAAFAGSGPPFADGTTAAGAISGQYIVVLEDGDAAAVASEHKQKYGAEVSSVYTHALKGYAAKLSPSGLAAVAADERVLYVSPDRVLEAASQTLPASVDRIDGELSSTRSGDGTGSVDVNVAVIDSGIDLDHPDLNVVGGVDCVKGVNGHGFDDDTGHGTPVAGVIAAKDNDFGVVGVAPGARLWAVKVIGNQEFTSISEIVCGVDWVTGTRTDGDSSNDIAVANMSIGGGGTDDGNCGRTVGDPLHMAICNSVAVGVPYVVAAANFGSDFQSTIPAAYDEVLTVTALRDLDGKPGGLSTGNGVCNPPDDVAASFSNFATLAADQAHTVAAPGVCVASTALGGGYLPGFGGTSFAAPHVAGIVALCRANGGCKGSPQDVTKKIRRNAADYNQANPDYGFLGDPLRPADGKYYGYLVRAALY
jgi:subtilisin